MNLEEYNDFCAALPHSTHIVQWGNAHVWKVGGKVFAIAGWHEGPDLAVTFKCSPIAFEMLKNETGVRPAPYLAARGFTWLQVTNGETLGEGEVQSFIEESYQLVLAGLNKRIRQNLSLL
jgi:predicted DNA-binding protein (MmcQ/YjbR family)